jgi:hypothetical protein
MPLHDESSLMTLGLLGTIGIMAICWFAYPGHLLLISCSGLVFALVGAWAIYAYQKARIRKRRAFTLTYLGRADDLPYTPVWAVKAWLQLAVIAIVAGFFINYPFPKRAAAAPVEELADVPYLEQISFRQGDLSLSFEPRAYLRDSLVTVEIAAKAGHKNKIRQVSLASGSSSAQGAQLADTGVAENPFSGLEGFATGRNSILPASVEDTLSVGLPMASLVEAGGTLIVDGWQATAFASSGNYISGDFERQMSLVALPLAQVLQGDERYVLAAPDTLYAIRIDGQAYVVTGRQVSGPYADASVVDAVPGVFVTWDLGQVQIHDGPAVYGPYEAIGTGELIFLARLDGQWSVFRAGVAWQSLGKGARAAGVTADGMIYYVISSQGREAVVVGDWTSPWFDKIERVSASASGVAAKVRSGWERHCLLIDPASQEYSLDWCN